MRKRTSSEYETDGGCLFLLVIVVVIVALCVWAWNDQQDFDTRCRARGGEPHHLYKSESLFLPPGVVIDVE